MAFHIDGYACLLRVLDEGQIVQFVHCLISLSQACLNELVIKAFLIRSPTFDHNLSSTELLHLLQVISRLYIRV